MVACFGWKSVRSFALVEDLRRNCRSLRLSVLFTSRYFSVSFFSFTLVTTKHVVDRDRRPPFHTHCLPAIPASRSTRTSPVHQVLPHTSGSPRLARS